jgi:F-type H+-transporting ATPase subunit epsilon
MADYDAQRVDVITPEGPVFEGEAEIVVVPGSAGQLGIMANHAPLVSSLKPGELHVTDMEGQRHEFATDGGFVEVRKNETLVLVGEAVPRDQIDAGEARARLERAQAQLEQARDGEGDLYRAERRRPSPRRWFRPPAICLSGSGRIIRTDGRERTDRTRPLLHQLRPAAPWRCPVLRGLRAGVRRGGCGGGGAARAVGG